MDPLNRVSTLGQKERERLHHRSNAKFSNFSLLCVAERHDASGLAISRRGAGVRGRSFAGSRRHPGIEAPLSGAKGRSTEANVAQPRGRATASNVGHIEPAGWYPVHSCWARRTRSI